jgi:uncharacterized protein (TIGR03118 family)
MRRLCLTGATIALAWLALAPATARAEYFQTNLVSNLPGLAQVPDPNLVNPWGMSFSGASPFWVSNQGKGLTSLYTVNPTTAAVTVVGSVPIPTTGPPPGPTGQVFNSLNTASTPAFHLVPGSGNTNAATFIFANLNGSISAWNGTIGLGNPAPVQVPTTVNPGSNYTGLAIGTSGIGPTLYAANNSLGRIDTFSGTFTPQGLSGTFTPPGLPPGLVPFNVQVIGNHVYVTYAVPGHFPQTMAPEGSGAVAVFDLNGNFVGPLITGGKLASPWGVAIAPASFGEFANDLLVGNFSYSHSEINAFDPTTGAFLGTISDFNGNPILNPGLWALTFGNGGSGGNRNVLYFTAGLNAETAGLFGSITPAAAVIPEPPSAALFALAAAGLLAYRSLRRRPRLTDPCY